MGNEEAQLLMNLLGTGAGVMPNVGTAALGVAQTIGGIYALNQAKKMKDPSYMSAAGPLLQQQALYENQYRTGTPQDIEDTMRERYRSNITELQNRFKETGRQGSSVFSRLAGLNINEGERVIAEKDYQARMLGLQGLGSTRNTLTNIGLKDVSQAKEDKRLAINTAGKAISSGLGNVASAANYLSMTKDSNKSLLGRLTGDNTTENTPESTDVVGAGLTDRLMGNMGGGLNSTSIVGPSIMGQPSLQIPSFGYPSVGQTSLLSLPKLNQYRTTSIYGL